MGTRVERFLPERLCVDCWPSGLCSPCLCPAPVFPGTGAGFHDRHTLSLLGSPHGHVHNNSQVIV